MSSLPDALREKSEVLESISCADRATANSPKVGNFFCLGRPRLPKACAPWPRPFPAQVPSYDSTERFNRPVDILCPPCFADRSAAWQALRARRFREPGGDHQNGNGIQACSSNKHKRGCGAFILGTLEARHIIEAQLPRAKALREKELAMTRLPR